METHSKPYTSLTADYLVDCATRNMSTVLDFKPIAPESMSLINSILQISTSRTCDYTIGGIYMWIDKFGYEYCVLDDTLFMKGVSENDPTVTAFSMPVGAMPLEKAVGLVLDYCREKGLQAVFSAVPEDRIDYLAALTGGDVEELEDWADYLYDAHELAALTGKKFNKKRNHVNRFLAENPHYEFETLRVDLLPEVLLFHTGLHSADGDDELTDYERNQCTRVLNHFLLYPFEGAVLRDETGEICAFTCGEVIGDTLYVHIEKMNHAIAGAGETINKLFAEYMTMRHPSVRFINREEDCGDPGLRHAKESYNPVMRLKKYNLSNRYSESESLKAYSIGA